MHFGLTVPVGITLLLGAVPVAHAQDSTATTVARALYGDIAVIVRAGPNQVRLGVDDGKRNMFLSFVGTDVRRWSDSTMRLFTRRRRNADSSTWRSTLNEPGLRSGTVSISIRPDSIVVRDRRRTRAVALVTLFFSDDSLHTVLGEVQREEALAFASIMRHASIVALGDAKAPRPGAKGRAKD